MALILADLFSFKGRVGRAYFWSVMITTSILLVITDQIFPVTSHMIALRSNIWGQDIVSYATPAVPGDKVAWFYLFGFYTCTIAIYWIFFAAIVKRLHGLDKSGKWVLVVIGCIFISTAIDAAAYIHGASQSLAFNLASLIFLVPAGGIGAWGMLMALFAPGNLTHYFSSKDATDIRNQAQ